MENNKTLLQELNTNNVFVSNEYTYFEFVEQLKKMQELTNKRVFKDEYHPVFRIDDATHELKKKAIRLNLTETEEFNKGIASLKVLEKELAISASGKKAEDRVDGLIKKYVTRPDVNNYRGIYLSNGVEDTEIDNVILTKDGIIILEVKNIKSDVTISEEGRLFIGKDSSYEQNPLVEKMNRKRKLFKDELKKTLKAKGVHIDIFLDSYVVFNEPYKTKCYVNNYSEEKWCKSTHIASIINNHTSTISYSDHELNILRECLSEFETCKKRFVPEFDPQTVKTDISSLIDAIEKATREENIAPYQKINNIPQEKKQRKYNPFVFNPFTVLNFGLTSIVCLTMATTGAILASKNNF